MNRKLAVFKIRKITRYTTKLLGLFLIVATFVGFQLHKEYHSHTTINYNKEEQSLQITMRLFTNDIDLALSKLHDKSFELGNKNETADANKILEMYLNQKFELSINEKLSSYQFLGKEIERDKMYLYLEVPNIKHISSISVKNGVLTELYFEQENIIKLHINDADYSMILTKRNDKGMLNF